MAGSKNPGWLRPDARGGKVAVLPHCVINSDAYRTASDRSKAALILLLLKYNGYNNGRIILSTAHLAWGLGNRNYKANARAMAELEARGIAVLTKQYFDGSRRAREYRLTFIPTPSQPATHDYLQWREGDAGTRQKYGWKQNRLAPPATTKTPSIAAAATDGKVSIAGAATEIPPTNEIPPFFRPSPVAGAATHINSHPSPLLPDSRNGFQTRCGVEGNHGKQGCSVVPNTEELRVRVRSFIATAGRGSQTVLAEAAKLSPSALSKFVNNCGGLSEAKLILLTCAIPKVEKTLL